MEVPMPAAQSQLGDPFRMLRYKVRESLKFFKKPKIIRRHIGDKIKAAAMKDTSGRVLIVIANDLSLPETGFYTVWGVYKYLSLKLTP
jgi:hypothetical protein